jgi:hypothetical protein
LVSNLEDVLIIPKTKITQLSKATKEHKELLGHLMLVANEVADALKIKESGFRVVINDGKEGCKLNFIFLIFHRSKRLSFVNLQLFYDFLGIFMC